MSSPLKVMAPAVGVKKPLSRLKQVVFPAPFGPIRPTISPSPTVMSTRLTAANPPKCFVRWCASSRAIRFSWCASGLVLHGHPHSCGHSSRTGCGADTPLPQGGELTGQGDEPTGQEQNGQQHGNGEKDRFVRTAPERLREQRQKEGPDNGTGKAAFATHEVIHQNVRGQQKAKLGGKEKADEV